MSAPGGVGARLRARWVGLLLWSFPRSFRHEHGRDVVEAHGDLYRDSGTLRRWLGWPLVTVDMLSSGIRLRLEYRNEVRGTRHTGRGGVFMANVASDIRYGVRSLLKAPGFTAVALLTVGLGIGANAAIFSVVNAVLLEPLPYERPDELVAVNSRFLPVSGFDFASFSLDPVEYLDYRDSNRTFSELAAFYGTGLTHTGDGFEAERVQGLVATWNLLPLLEVSPHLGRLFVAEDDLPDAPTRVVLSHGFWERAYGADEGLVGRTVTLQGQAAEVVGVLPEGFFYPRPNVEVFTTLNLGENPSGRQSHYLQGLARLAPGITLEQAQADMDRIMAQWEADYPDIHTGHFFIMEPLKDARVGDVDSALWLLMGAVGFVMLVVCANVANLLLVRGQTRQRETAIRTALGAGRYRLLQSALIHSGLLAVGGAALGLGLAYVGLDGLLALAGRNLPRAEEVTLDGSVFGLIPAVQTVAGQSLSALTEGGRSGTARSSTLRARNGLVMAEVALSIVPVVGAGLTMRSFARLMADETGYDSEGVLIASVSLPRASYPEPEELTAFYDRLLERVQGMPGVVAASASTNLPVFSGPTQQDFELQGVPEPEEGEPNWNAATALVRPGYFEAMRTPVLTGRGIEASDRSSSPPVVVVSESLVRRFLGDRDPVGMQMRFTGDEDRPWWTIVGVVADVQLQGLGQDRTPAYYLAHEQSPVTLGGRWGSYMTLVVRTGGDPLHLTPGLRTALAELDPELPLIAVQSYEEVLVESVAQPRLLMTLMGIFATVALILGAVGIYGVTAYAVTQRRHEIGIRLALGAKREEVARLVMRKGMGPVAAGVALGVLGALAGSRVMESLLFEVSRTDVVTYGSVIAVLTAVGLVACWIPARRAMRVGPMTTLKAE